MCDRPPQHAASETDEPPAPWLTRWAEAAPPGPALDLACGGGRNARWLAAQGRAVTALDRDLTPLHAHPADPLITPLRADLEDGSPWPVAPRRFTLVAVFRYLWRPILPQIFDAVAPGGLLIYETFRQGHEVYGRPRNPDFLLAPGELRDAAQAAGWAVLGFEDGLIADPRPAMLQRLAARRPVA